MLLSLRSSLKWKTGGLGDGVKIGAVKSDGRDLFTNKMIMINGRVWRERLTLAVYALIMECLRQRGGGLIHE